MIITFNDEQDARELKKEIEQIIPAESLDMGTSRAFSGSIQTDLLILLTTIAPVIIQKIAELVSKKIQTKGEREVKINGISIKGYNVDDIVKIMNGSSGATNQGS
jgi:hypothetical protein